MKKHTIDMNVNIVNVPDKCPYCGSNLIRRKNSDGEVGVDIICSNIECIGIKKAHLNFVIGKDCFDIKDFGESTVNLLFDNHIINNWWEIFNLSVNDFINKAGMTQYSAEKIYYNIQNAKNLATAEILLYSIGIKSIGRLKAKKIINVFGSLDLFIFVDDIINQLIKEIGPESTKTLQNEFRSDRIHMIIDYFKTNGFNLTNDKIEKEIISNNLKDLKILASGTFENYSRDEIKKVVESHGGIYASGVNKTLDILICGKNIGPSKLDKAKKLNIKMISEKEFQEMIKID